VWGRFLSLGFPGSVAFIAVQAPDGWMSPFIANDADCVSLDTAGAHGPRKPDGSLPDILFLHIAKGSGLIDRSANVGLPHRGSAGSFVFRFDGDRFAGGTYFNPLPVAKYTATRRMTLMK